MAYKAIIAGASGLIGSKLLPLLLQHTDYDEVLVLVRKQLPLTHKKLVQAVIDFDKLDDYSSMLTGRAVFCCLGTTQKQTPDRKQYYKIDHDYPVQLARIAKANGVPHFHLISAIGANAASSNFYLKMKGETERDVMAADVKSLHIYQPSFLKGRTDGSRPAENFINGFMNLINPLLISDLKKYKSIKSETVAQAMVNQSLNAQAGVFIYPTDKIKKLA